MKINKHQIETLLELLKASKTGFVYASRRADLEAIETQLQKELLKLTS